MLDWIEGDNGGDYSVVIGHCECIWWYADHLGKEYWISANLFGKRWTHRDYNLNDWEIQRIADQMNSLIDSYTNKETITK